MGVPLVLIFGGLLIVKEIEKKHKKRIIQKAPTFVGAFWRGRRDLNPRAGFPAYSLSRGAPSASWVLLQVEWIA